MKSILKTDRIHLTQIKDDDITQIAERISDFGLQRLVNLGMNFPMDEEVLRNPDSWFQADLHNEKSRVFAIRTIVDDIFIGTCALVNLNMFTHSAEIGINLSHPAYRGKGYGREIMVLLMRYGFLQFNLNRIYLRVVEYNTRAILLYERLGFRHEVREREMTFRDGRYYDQLIMGMLRSEWDGSHG